MKNLAINSALALGNIDQKGVFPHLDQLAETSFIFEVDFGLDSLPVAPGVLLIRGARQYGKSTWLESALKQTIIEFGPGTAFYLNGDMLLELNKLEAAIEELLVGFKQNAPVKRIFIDEITAIPHWEVALKRMLDSGLLHDVLVVTTGSNATDIRRGAERLPGRKGKLDRTNYLFTPISYKEFHRVCHQALQEKTLPAYILSGGSPVACKELANTESLPEYVVEQTRDWVDGEIARHGRARHVLNNIFQVLYRFGGAPVGQAKLAREANLANNTVAAGYIELLNDLGVVIPSFAYDQHKQLAILRKPSKFHFTNLLVAFAYHPQRIRRIDEYLALSRKEQGVWLEWLVAQELLRRSANKGELILEPQLFWQNKLHEIDFVLSDSQFIEVKRGECTALEFAWFVKQFPNKQLTVVNKNSFSTENIMGYTFEEFLLQ